MDNKQALKDELNKLSSEFLLSDHSPEMKAKGERIREIKSILGLEPVKPRKSRRPAKVVNR